MAYLKIHLYGSLSLTGKGHATDYAVILGLSGADPERIPIPDIEKTLQAVKQAGKLLLNGEREIPFDSTQDIQYHRKFLPFHANGLKFEAGLKNGEKKTQTYYSIGGGFVVVKERKNAKKKEVAFNTLPYPIQKGHELLAFCAQEKMSISELVLENERSLRQDAEIDHELGRIWDTMLECMYTGCHTQGTLPGGLKVKRRAFELHQKLKGPVPYEDGQGWLLSIRQTEVKFRQILQWVSCFALGVNEVNAPWDG